ncbi:MAG: sugar phosphate isomerase/epimerase family protein [Bacteroidota bacterium]
MNKIGFRTVGFRGWPLERALQAIAAIGYDGAELCLEHPQMRPEALPLDECGRIAGIVRATGLEIASVSYHGDREEHCARLTGQLRAIEITQALGSEILILNSEHVIAGQEKYQWDTFVREPREELLPAALEAGVALAIEPEPGMYVHGSREMLALIEEVDHPALAVNLDIGHAWLTDDDLLQSIRNLAPHLVHLHWEDFPAGEHKHLVPGEGDMPLAEIHRTLREIGYDGYYTIDLFNIADDPESYARASLGPTQTLLQGG